MMGTTGTFSTLPSNDDSKFALCQEVFKAVYTYCLILSS